MHPYQPAPLPPPDIDWVSLIPQIGDAHAALAEYNGTLRGIINPAVLLSPLTRQEEVLSSRIEGTQATLGEVLAFEAGSDEDLTAEKRDDIGEIINYRRAMNQAILLMQHRPLSLRLIRDLHAILMDGVRGQNKAPGEFRRIQNWIGHPGATMEPASFVPPAPQDILDHLEAWEAYLHQDDRDPLAQLAIVHAQFELIHPFLDGNGRLGRMLVPLFLFHKQRLNTPMFYMSAYLEAHRDDYYDCLAGISQRSDWTGWIRFFLIAIAAQARDNLTKAQGILDLYERKKQRVQALTRSRFSLAAVDTLFERPIINSRDFVSLSGIPKRSAMRILGELCDGGVLKLVRPGAGRRSAVYMLTKLIELTEGRSFA